MTEAHAKLSIALSAYLDERISLRNTLLAAALGNNKCTASITITEDKEIKSSTVGGSTKQISYHYRQTLSFYPDNKIRVDLISCLLNYMTEENLKDLQWFHEHTSKEETYALLKHFILKSFNATFEKVR